ncbi:uncharacterized protein LOC144624521 [Crassostrea virginica]
MQVALPVLLCSVLGLQMHMSLVTAYENVSLSKPAWQLHPYYTYRWEADLAVDGRYSDMSYFDGKQCAISAYSKRTAEWWVDLGRLVSIHHVFIQYLTNNEPWELSQFPSTFLGFFLYVSNTTKRNDRVLYYHDDHYTDKTIPSIVTITKPVQARYVTYYNTRKGDLSTKPCYSATASFGVYCQM